MSRRGISGSPQLSRIPRKPMAISLEKLALCEKGEPRYRAKEGHGRDEPADNLCHGSPLGVSFE